MCKFVKNYISMRNKIFAILYYSSLLDQIQFLGTGFVVSKGGFFITAGHTLGQLGQIYLDKGKFRAVFIDDSSNYRSVPFSTICYKYLSKGKQSPPVLYDIAYGCLKEGEYEYFMVEDKLSNIGEILIAPHYKSANQSNFLGKSFEDTIDISLLMYFNPSMSVLKIVNASVLDNEYSNCMQLTQSTKIAKGASGCPLVNTKGYVSGLFVAASEVDDKRYALNALSIYELSKD